jgi:hypothetical protein
MAEPRGDGEPADPAADPRAGLEWDGGEQTSEEDEESAVRVARLEKEIAPTPGRVGEVPGLAAKAAKSSVSTASVTRRGIIAGPAAARERAWVTCG